MSKVEQKPKPAYRPPALVELGTLHDLTLDTRYCDKSFGGSDGFTFQQVPIHCTSG